MPHNSNTKNYDNENKNSNNKNKKGNNNDNNNKNNDINEDDKCNKPFLCCRALEASLGQWAIYSIFLNVFLWTHWMVDKLPYFPALKMHRPMRRTVIFLLVILEKNNDECILILVIYWKNTGLLHTKISNQNIIYSS